MEPDTSQLIVGPGKIYLAPLGTALPNLTGSVAVFGPGWIACGYTDAGIAATYTPKTKPEYVDEQAAAVLDILETEEFFISAKLAELSLRNVAAAISACTYTPPSAGQPQISVGSLPLQYTMICTTGPAPDTYTQRVILVQKALTISPIAMHMTRKDKQTLAVKWDARQIAGQPLFTIQDLGTGYEGS